MGRAARAYLSAVVVTWAVYLVLAWLLPGVAWWWLVVASAVAVAAGCLAADWLLVRRRGGPG